MRLNAALKGDLKKFMMQELADAGAGITKGVETVTMDLKGKLRDQVRSAGLGDRLANAWRGKYYPNKVLNAAGMVWSNARDIHHAFEEGSLIRGKEGQYLAIPTIFAKRLAGIGRKKKVTPKELIERGVTMYLLAANTYGPGKPRRPTLVARELFMTADGRTSTRTHTKSGKRREGTRTRLPLFVLVPQVKLRRRLDIGGAFAWAVEELPRRIMNNYRSTPIAEV
jgi:hypothetical protein